MVDTQVLLPRKVPTVPEGRAILRRRQFPKSATTRLPPRASKERLRGPLNAAEVPVPSRKAGAPVPASVPTAPPGDITRMRWLPASETYRAPVPTSRASP